MRQRIWQAMRIIRHFTIPDLCRAVDGATVANVQSFVSRLFKEGYVSKLGTVRRGHAGEYQGYQLTNDIGPTMPVFLKGRHHKETETETDETSENRDVTSPGKLPPAAAGGRP
jgi:hypothetical protein